MVASCSPAPGLLFFLMCCCLASAQEAQRPRVGVDEHGNLVVADGRNTTTLGSLLERLEALETAAAAAAAALEQVDNASSNIVNATWVASSVAALQARVTSLEARHATATAQLLVQNSGVAYVNGYYRREGLQNGRPVYLKITSEGYADRPVGSSFLEVYIYNTIVRTPATYSVSSSAGSALRGACCGDTTAPGGICVGTPNYIESCSSGNFLTGVSLNMLSPETETRKWVVAHGDGTTLYQISAASGQPPTSGWSALSTAFGNTPIITHDPNGRF
eukprot:m.155895 g.155895  ORF g.155895 m.155895 type:complete len:276 (+) comp20817_c4_seq1:16923-17750(+)